MSRIQDDVDVPLAAAVFNQAPIKTPFWSHSCHSRQWNAGGCSLAASTPSYPDTSSHTQSRG